MGKFLKVVTDGAVIGGILGAACGVISAVLAWSLGIT